jgi:hypothetical protein
MMAGSGDWGPVVEAQREFVWVVVKIESLATMILTQPHDSFAVDADVTVVTLAVFCAPAIWALEA